MIVDYSISKSFVSDPIWYHIVSLWSLVLRYHMASTVNSSEGKSIILFSISSNLIIKEIWSPWFLNFPIKHVDPLESSISWYSTINITRVEKHSVLVLKFFINPLWTNLWFSIVNTFSTEIPSLYRCWDMEEWSNSFIVKVGNNWITECAWWQFFQVLWHLLVCPWSVILCGIWLLVWFSLTLLKESLRISFI